MKVKTFWLITIQSITYTELPSWLMKNAGNFIAVLPSIICHLTFFLLAVHRPLHWLVAGSGQILADGQPCYFHLRSCMYIYFRLWVTSLSSITKLWSVWCDTFDLRLYEAGEVFLIGPWIVIQVTTLYFSCKFSLTWPSWYHIYSTVNISSVFDCRNLLTSFATVLAVADSGGFQ